MSSQRVFYEGTAKGKQDVALFPKLSEAEQARHTTRWEAAKKAVENLAKGGEPAKFLYNMSNLGGKRKLEAWEQRVGGNDFSTKGMHR